MSHKDNRRETKTVELSLDDWGRIRRALAYVSDSERSPARTKKYSETLEALEEELRVQ